MEKKLFQVLFEMFGEFDKNMKMQFLCLKIRFLDKPKVLIWKKKKIDYFQTITFSPSFHLYKIKF